VYLCTALLLRVLLVCFARVAYCAAACCSVSQCVLGLMSLCCSLAASAFFLFL